jgi:CDP-diacylglycerol--glycerol-3-phosphate 3-phosphatidyltransferase
MAGPALLFTMPNILSLSRIPLAIGAALLLEESRWASLALALTAVATDFFDGFVARRTGTVSEAGKILDPVADKIAFVIYTIALASMGRIPAWLPAALIGREILVVAGGLFLWRSLARRMGERVPSSNIWGKTSTLLLAVYLIKQALAPAAPVMAGLDWFGLLAMLSLLLSSVAYLARLIRALSGPGPGEVVRG